MLPLIHESSTTLVNTVPSSPAVVTTRLLVSPTVYTDSADLVFGFKRQDSTAGGVMVVASSSGAKLWQQELYEVR